MSKESQLSRSNAAIDAAGNEETMKRQREAADFEISGSSSKMRKTADVFIDLTCDSPRESLNSNGTKLNVGNTESNKSIENVREQCEREPNGSDTNPINVIVNNKVSPDEIKEHFDVNDSALMREFCSEFSDDDDGGVQADSARDDGISLTQSQQQPSSLLNCQPLNKDWPNQLVATDSGLPGCESHLTEGLDDLFDDWDDEKYDLDLSDFKRCKVVDIDRGRRTLRITVQDPRNAEKAVILCSGNWLEMTITLGEYVIVKAKQSPGEWIVNNDVGLIVTQADELVSGTSVVGGLFCTRKGVFDNRFRGIDSLPNVLPTDAAMTCGNVIHELLQAVLAKQIHDLDGIKRQLDVILKKPYTIQMLYASGLKSPEFREMIDEYIPKVFEFIDRYLLGNVPQILDSGYNGKIESVKDIEESIWLPSLGIKGKIDVTIEVSCHDKRKLMPLEIKTGRASYSAEHKGQLYLYCMMLVTLGYDVDSGLLLYIKDNVMQEIKSTRNEQRDLILLRNAMAYYLTKEPTPEENTEGALSKEPTKWQLPEMPEPIYHATACKKCMYNTICCVYASRDENLHKPDTHPHVKLTKKILKDLTSAHIDYVINWVSMLRMEESYKANQVAPHEIWVRKPERRERCRRCLSYMKLDLPVVIYDESFLHKFSRAPNTLPSFPVDNFHEVFEIHDYVMVNTDKRINIISGNVIEVTKDSITLLLPKDLSLRGTMIYHLDDFPPGNFPFKIVGTVAAMLADNDITRRLRKIVIDREPATFERPLPSAMTKGEGRKILQHLNPYQREALMAVIKADDYVLIKGMPGTGKTQTLVALIHMLTHLGNSVLITAHTHAAVDNILLKLHEKNINFLRLGSKYRCHDTINHKTDVRLLQQCETVEQLDAQYNKQSIVAVTCLGSHHILLSKRIFDYCVVDECTQALQPILLRPLFNARKLVFVGDPEQLPAVVTCLEARKLGMNEDMFTRLDSENNTRVLKLQYRMNTPIMELANRLTYRGELLMANDTVANATIKWQNPQILESSDKWVKRVLSDELKHAVVVLNTKATYGLNGNLSANRRTQDGEDESSKCSNLMEAVIIMQLLKVLLAAGVCPSDIGVIAPFKAQIVLLKRILPENVEINTVDQYQGRDKSVILFSCTKSIPADTKLQNSDEYDILDDHKRLNVALTRAKHKLILVGDKVTLVKYTPFKKLFDIVNDEVIDLVSGSDDFSWHKLRDTMKGPRFETIM